MVKKMEKQTRLAKQEIKYSYGPYNIVKRNKQRIRITEGCPHNCPYCYEPTEIKVFGIPELKRNLIEINDMNLLCKPKALKIIRELGKKKVNGKVVYYDLMCGIDYRFLTKELADLLYKNRFGIFNRKDKFIRKIRLAWDWFYKDQYKIKKAIDMLKETGYKSDNIMIYIICNWKIKYEECCLKLDLLKIWGVQVCDCYYDNQVFPNVVPVNWTDKQNKSFRSKCRKHNHLVNYKIDPEVKQ